MLKIFGFGTLVYRDSALLTCPGLKNFKPALVKDVTRIFGKVNLRAAYRGDVDWDEMKVASCFLEDKPGKNIIGVSFDIPLNEWPSMRARELDYDCRQVEVFDPVTGAQEGKALTFFGYPDDEAFFDMLSEGDKIYLNSRRRGYPGAIYRDGIYPADSYLKRCFKAYGNKGEEAMENFLDNSYLSDRKTTMRDYVTKHCPHYLEKE